MERSQQFPWVLLLLASACGGDADPSDTFGETGPTTGSPGENSPFCAPVVELESETGGETESETGGEVPFPPDGEVPILYTCEGAVKVDISGRVCLCGNGETGVAKDCAYDIDLLPSDQATNEGIGIPSPLVNSSLDMYPEPEIGACCLQPGPNVDESDLEEALNTVCGADCGARACVAVYHELVAILSDDACFWSSFDSASCHLDMGQGCVGKNDYGCLQGCGQAEILGATRSDIMEVLKGLQTPVRLTPPRRPQSAK